MADFPVITRNGNLAPLNAELLHDLVTWAAADHTAITDKVFHGWGDWDQGIWAKKVVNGACQTSYCIAGQAVVQAGFGLEMENYYEYADGETREFRASYCAPKLFDGLDDKGRAKFKLDHSNLAEISKTAREVLGLTHNEADALFQGENTIGDVVNYAVMFAQKRGQDLRLDDEVLAKRVFNLERVWSYVGGEYPEIRPFEPGSVVVHATTGRQYALTENGYLELNAFTAAFQEYGDGWAVSDFIAPTFVPATVEAAAS